MTLAAAELDCTNRRTRRLAVMLRVHFRSVVMMLGRVQRMTVSDFGVVRGFFVMSGFVMLGRLAMVFRRLLVVVRGFFMVLVNAVIHDPLLG